MYTTHCQICYHYCILFIDKEVFTIWVRPYVVSVNTQVIKLYSRNSSRRASTHTSLRSVVQRYARKHLTGATRSATRRNTSKIHSCAGAQHQSHIIQGHAVFSWRFLMFFCSLKAFQHSGLVNSLRRNSPVEDFLLRLKNTLRHRFLLLVPLALVHPPLSLYSQSKHDKIF